MTERTSPPTIMVVDDTPENLDLLREMLEREGYRVQAFPRGALALKAAQIRPPDLILLDVMMPEMSGFEVCERFKADAALKEIPVLFISALTETADKVKAFAAGGVDYVTKPFQFEEVHARVKAHLELRRQRRELQDAYGKLRELEVLRDELTHMIVHEMRSPLTGVGQGLDLLREHIPDGDEATLELWRMSMENVQRRRDEEERRESLEAQLQQAQKMESVGRLAGGVAHDFNNMLGVIIGHTELVLDKVPPDDPMRADLEEVLNAARRSSDITRQLLAFARRQTISPKVIDLNEVVEGMLKMLRRLIGEDITVLWQPGPGRKLVFMDPSQLDQILANLCVNSRDSIEGVGRIAIETDHVRFDDEYCADHVGCVPGDFILLAVSDDGCGMDKETLGNIFEPFFTTKGVGEGTGLGLATVYGIVRQNDGLINVYSEPGKGTTFKIYLPLCMAEDAGMDVPKTAEIPGGRGETVLIVEDESSILELAQRMLERLDYTVFAAATPAEAMALAEAHTGEIQLLITDVVMPEMNGRELAENLQTHSPDLTVLFMSGYTANVIAHRGVLDEGVNFIQKPFSSRELGLKVRKALGGGTEEGSGPAPDKG